MEPSASEQEPTDILQTDKGCNPTEKALNQTTQHGGMINMPLQYTKNVAYLFRTMIDGLVTCNKLQELQYWHIIALLTSIEQGLIESLPQTIGKCIWALNAKKYDKDRPHFNQAMTGKYAIEYKAAIEMEVEALQRVKMWTEML